MIQPTKVPGGTVVAIEPFKMWTGEMESKYRATSTHTGEQLVFWTLACATFWLWLVNERVAGAGFRAGMELAV